MRYFMLKSNLYWKCNIKSKFAIKIAHLWQFNKKNIAGMPEEQRRNGLIVVYKIITNEYKMCIKLCTR